MGKWIYTDSSVCSVGLMVCTRCEKPIESGEFRYRETGDAYLPQHRACSLSDPEWQRRDEQRDKYEKEKSEYLSECEVFADRWGLDPSDLQELKYD